MTLITDSMHNNNLKSWLFAIGLMVILLISSGTSYLLSEFIEEHLIRRDAAVLEDFVAKMSLHHDPTGYFKNSYERDGSNLNDFFNDIAHMPDVARINAYSTNNIIVWSSDSAMVGQQFPENHELEEALEGELVYEKGDISKLTKPEHLLLAAGLEWFIENYIPIKDSQTQSIVGVVEIYRIPIALSKSIAEGKKLIWVFTSIGGLVLIITLFIMLHFSNRHIQKQQQSLIKQIRLNTIGEMASSIAQSMNNAVSTIRTATKNTLAENSEPAITDNMDEILFEVEQFDNWLNELQVFTHDEVSLGSTTNISEVLQNSIEHISARSERMGIKIFKTIPDTELLVRADSALLIQVMVSLCSNSLDAMPQGGQLILESSASGSDAVIRVSDTGLGIPPENIEHIFDPLVSHKKGGLGLGLALARKIILRFSGSININSTVGSGTNITIILPTI